MSSWQTCSTPLATVLSWWTAFLRAAEARGARTLDGLGMLVYQGAIAFQMWTGVEAPINVMRRALEEVFGT